MSAAESWSAPDERAWHGRVSLVAVVVATLVAMAVVGRGGWIPTGARAFLPWVLGVPLLFGRGAIRQVGVGVLASGLVSATWWVHVWLAFAGT